MTTALRRQIVRYLTSVRQQSTLERRVAKFVRILEQRHAKLPKPNRPIEKHLSSEAQKPPTPGLGNVCISLMAGTEYLLWLAPTEPVVSPETGRVRCKETPV